jgi:hypothetical protein
MTTYSRDGAQGASWPRTAAGVVVGLLVIAITNGALTFALVPIMARHPSWFFMDIGSMILAMGIACFLGGFCGRRVAGLRPAARGGVGAIIIAMFIAISIFLPHYSWDYVSGKGWEYTGVSGNSIPPNAVMIHDYTVLLTVIVLIYGGGLAYLGNRVAMRKWRAKGEPALPVNTGL